MDFLLTVFGCLDEEKKGGITGSMGRGDGDGRSHREEGQHVDNYWSSSEWQALLLYRRNSVCMDLTFLCIQLVLFSLYLVCEGLNLQHPSIYSLVETTNRNYYRDALNCNCKLSILPL